uniref:Uncharacterized protein n=1 Tax=Tanacetum cinerariifolium TaxID=118510 RepID=A0A6L2NTF7_TANCI|nr:hypothetical protein [Tanacetum cinerariifolium]
MSDLNKVLYGVTQAQLAQKLEISSLRAVRIFVRALPLKGKFIIGVEFLDLKIASTNGIVEMPNVDTSVSVRSGEEININVHWGA